MLLEAEGYDVVGEAEDGAGGIAAARELEPDVVLLDIQLPDIDGFEVAARLTANGGSPAIVLVSSRAREDSGRWRAGAARAASSPSPSCRARRWRRCCA